jgi:hypothetical protein
VRCRVESWPSGERSEEVCFYSHYINHIMGFSYVKMSYTVQLSKLYWHNELRRSVLY